MFSEEVGHRSSHLSPRLLTISFSAAKYVIMNHGTSLTMRDAGKKKTFPVHKARSVLYKIFSEYVVPLVFLYTARL